ncbi:Fur family transcriptional regulator [Amorphus sp. 3PC139-8]|uniref:Fur family transcriptional regulator n=1 Tax=Amorphus sp. 3PC139-8 TaxID=2735676 RepID=UPI00345D0924
MGGLRQDVLALLRDEARLLTAYQLLRRLRVELGRPIAPTSIYRCLYDLIHQGLVTRVESLNAYVATGEQASPGAKFLLICQGCGETISLIDGEVTARLETDADRVGFAIDRSVLELLGTCQTCQAASQTGTARQEART